MMNWSEFSFILKPSPIGGVGVFATHDLPSGIPVFSGKFEPRKMKIKEIPAALIQYCVFLNDEECLCPERFDRMEMGWYINHSDQPNVKKISDKNIVTIYEIKSGEEILIDYNNLNEPENMKESFYIK